MRVLSSLVPIIMVAGGVLGLGFLASSSSCVGTQEATVSADGPRDTLVVGFPSDIGNLISIVNETLADQTIVEALAIPTLDADFDCSLKRKPGLAKTWEWNDEGTVLKMELRDDISWEDGTPVTAKDFALTYELIADSEVISPRFGYVAQMTEDGRPTVVDDTHIEWRFTRPYDRDTQAAHASYPLIPAHKLESVERGSIRSHPLAREPLSYGPFKLTKWEPNQRFVLEANDKFTGPDEWKANLKRVIFRIIPEYTSRIIALQSGEIDMMEHVQVADADRIRENHPEIKLVRRGWRTNDFIAWNMGKWKQGDTYVESLFADKRVRKAMALATNVDSMIERLLTSKTGEKFARPSVSTITPALCGVHNDDIKRLDYNEEAAKALLAEAGWKDTDGDGIIDKDGRPMSFTLTTNSGNKRRADASILFQDQMKKLGIEVKLATLEGNTFFANLRTRDYEASLAGWSAALFVDPTGNWMCETEDNPRAYNFTQFCDPEVDQLIEQALRTPDPKESAPLWKEFQARIYEEQPYLFLWWMDEIVAIHERFENAQINVLSPRLHLHSWEVPADKVKYK